MLAFTPTPEVNWPLAPHGAGEIDPGHGAVPGMGLFSMLRGKLNPQACVLLQVAPPWSRSLHRLHTLCVAKLVNSLATTVAVQVPGAQYPVPASAVSKKGCGLTAATAPALPPAPQAAKDVVQPIAASTAA